jgi:transcriptional regulator
MYIPRHFQVTDMRKLYSFIKENSFGVLFSYHDGEPFATHLPFLIEKNDNGEYYLLSHFAKSNPHWKSISDQVLVVFQGPHSYISASWYQERHTVPTWNYIAVHVYGDFILIEDKEELVKLIEDTVDFYESSFDHPWTTDLSDDFNRKLMEAIVGFKIKINRIEGKWKLSQNHSAERRSKIIAGLRTLNDSNSHQIADLMEQELISVSQEK